MIEPAPAEVAPVAIRMSVPDDHAFILATWLRCFRHESMHAKRLTNAVFFDHHHPIVTAILGRATTYVATLEDDPNVILGYLTTEKRNHSTVLHFAYVKAEFRRMRVLSQLMRKADLPPALLGVDVSHPTYDWLNILAPKYPGARSNPYVWGNLKETHAPA